MTDNIELTRRKVLVGAGVVGTAGAGTGLGTSALFGDEEQFTNTTLTAGELDLVVSYATEYDGAGDLQTTSGTVDGEPGILFSLHDVKPGDSGRGRICFGVVDNAAWVWLQAGVATDAENGVTEPEAGASAEHDPLGPDSGTDQSGELADALVSEWWYELSSPPDVDDDGSSDPNVDGDLFDDDFNAGLRLDGDPATPDADPFTGSETLGDAPFTHCLAFSWRLPADVGNEVQSDSVTFPIRLFAEQARNNDTPDNPVANVEI